MQGRTVLCLSEMVRITQSRNAHFSRGVGDHLILSQQPVVVLIELSDLISLDIGFIHRSRRRHKRSHRWSLTLNLLSLEIISWLTLKTERL